MSKNLIYVGIAALAIIAVVLGYKIYQQQTGITTQVPSSSDPAQTQPPLSEATSSARQIVPLQSENDPERKAVLNFPGPNASEEEKKKHMDLVNKLGNESATSVLHISGCHPVPVVYRVNQGSSFKVKNIDSQDHVIYTDQKTTIKANSEQTVPSSAIGDNLGVYLYGCDDSSESGTGIIQIVPPQ